MDPHHRSQIDRVDVAGGIIFLPVSVEGRTPAQWTNFFAATAKIYEDLWRVRSLGILSGRPFPVQEECSLLTSALSPVPGGLYLDLGSSTGLYARALARHAQGMEGEEDAQVVAIDISTEMSKQARRKAREEGVRLFLLRADVTRLPFASASVDGLCMGGTLNELGRTAETCLSECRRVLKPGGRFFMMHLLRAQTITGRVLQGVAATGGIRFWSLEQSNQMFRQAGFTVLRQQVDGVVCITTLS